MLNFLNDSFILFVKYFIQYIFSEFLSVTEYY